MVGTIYEYTARKAADNHRKEPMREEPNIPAMPYSLKPMASAAATKVKLVPITLGKRIPIGPKPYIGQRLPHQKLKAPH